jgi:hypothetical protein
VNDFGGSSGHAGSSASTATAAHIQIQPAARVWGAMQAEEETRLIELFRDCRLEDVVVFLRFCYCPEDLTPATVSAVESCMPGVLRLAHKLRAKKIIAWYLSRSCHGEPAG